jgi:hypothetical protein
MTITYSSSTLRRAGRKVVEQANSIIDEYAADGYSLTLRQLYYQFVSRGWISNTIKDYKRLGSIVNEGRLQGLIDWDAIEDRTRNLTRLATWENPAVLVRAGAAQFRIDLWEHQQNRIEVWVEKEALAGVIERTCKRNRVPFLSCRGYCSQSEMHAAAMRLVDWVAASQDVVILHLGDHDPSGIDMSRDIQSRLEMFMGDAYGRLTFRRLALNMDQVREFHPPPNPAKETDKRFEAYRAEFGSESWELDALEPAVIDKLIESAIGQYRDEAQWAADQAMEDQHRATLQATAERMEAAA